MTIPEMVTINQAAERTNVSAHAIRQWVKDGSIRSVKSGNRVYIPFGAVIRFLQGEDFTTDRKAAGGYENVKQ